MSRIIDTYKAALESILERAEHNDSCCDDCEAVYDLAFDALHGKPVASTEPRNTGLFIEPVCVSCGFKDTVFEAEVQQLDRHVCSECLAAVREIQHFDYTI